MQDAMKIRKAEPNEFRNVRLFYHSLIDAMEGTPYHPKWKKDIYPSPEDLKAAIDEHTLYLGTDGERIAAAMVLNRKCNAEYADAAWSQPLDRDEFAVIHMLGVHRNYQGRGYAKQLVGHAIDLARQAGIRAIRLDVLKGNEPAKRLYTGLGFRHAGTLPLFYEDTGRVEFELYEYAIGR